MSASPIGGEPQLVGICSVVDGICKSMVGFVDFVRRTPLRPPKPKVTVRIGRGSPTCPFCGSIRAVRTAYGLQLGLLPGVRDILILAGTRPEKLSIGGRR